MVRPSQSAVLVLAVVCGGAGCKVNGNSVDAHNDVVPAMLDNAAAAPGDDSPLVTASPTGITLGSKKIGSVADVPEHPDFAPLASALAPLLAASKSDVRILAHQSVPFQALLTLATTAAHAGAKRVVLLGKDSHGKMSGVALAPAPLANATLVMELPRGFVVSTKAGHVAPGCKGLGPGMTVPRHTLEGNEVPDYDALRSCLFELRSARGEPKLTGDALVVTEDDRSITEVASLYQTIGVILSVNAAFEIAIGDP